MEIVIGNDHAGVELKNKITQTLKDDGYTIINQGTDSHESVDYPDFIHPVAKHIENNQNSKGIIICGSGNGAAMTANKYKKIRAALCWNEKLSKLAREHNDANILSLPARFLETKEALKIVKTFLNTSFEKGRHLKRVNKITP
ncbi:MAG: ribose 5-phosphate isomerase B [Flavobacteriaceae bacterium]|nr:ribose 5-phosphate isomerase B [Flavobacteriaceae bacterium]|tara:strand:+ start:41226 stop:41654 length:429 start_codon:yes stop_codon:yes gene_type:complete